MGATKNDDLRVGFDCRLKLKVFGSKVTGCAKCGMIQMFEVAVPRRT